MQIPPTTLVTRLSFGGSGVANGIGNARFFSRIDGAVILSFYQIDQAGHDPNLASLRVGEAEALASDAPDLQLGASTR